MLISSSHNFSLLTLSEHIFHIVPDISQGWTLKHLLLYTI